MAPKPEFAMEYQYSSTRFGSIQSPTSVISGVRKPPKCTHYPRSKFTYDHRGRQIDRDKIRSPTPEKVEHTHDHRGRTISPDQTPAHTQDTAFFHGANLRRRSLRVLGENVHACTTPGLDFSPPYTKQDAAKNFNVCLDTTVVAAGEFSMTTAEIYRQECRSEGRGREYVHSGSQSDRGGKKGIGARLGSTDDNSLTEKLQAAEQIEFYGEDKGRKKNDFWRGALGSAGSPRRRNLFVGTNGLMEDELAFSISPPRGGRTPAAAEPRADPGNLVEARMELYQLGQDGLPPPANKLARALQGLKRQDKVIEGWKRQLLMAQKHLAGSFAELEQTKKESQGKQRKATEIRARAVQERKQVQVMYEAEVEQRNKLEVSLAKLQSEISTLKVTLQNARSKSTTVSRAAPDSAANQSQIMALKADVVDLRLRLAKCHAMNIELRCKDEDTQAIRKHSVDSVRLFHERIERKEEDFKTARPKLEQNMKAIIVEENNVRLALENIAAKEESEKLKQEIAELQEKLRSNEFSENVSTTMEDPSHLKSKLTILEEEIEMRKQQLKVKSEVVASQARRIAELESFSNDRGCQSSHKGQSLEGEILTLKRNEAKLWDEVSRQQTTIEQERKQTIEPQSLLRAQSANESVRFGEKSSEQIELVAKLRKEIIALEEKADVFQRKEESKDYLETKVHGVEYAYKSEIAVLKAKLSEAETRYAEEIFHAEEERRLNKKMIARYAKELEEILEKHSDDKTRLREELEEFRKQLFSGIGGTLRRSPSMSQGVDQSINVIQLRKTLASARARLAAAPDKTGHLGSKSSSSSILSVQAKGENRSNQSSSMASVQAKVESGSNQTSSMASVQGKDDNGSNQTTMTWDQFASSSLRSTWAKKKSDKSDECLSQGRFKKINDKKAPLNVDILLDEDKDAPLDIFHSEEKVDDHIEDFSCLRAANAPLHEAPSETIPRARSSALQRNALRCGQPSLIDAEDDDTVFLTSLVPRRPLQVGDRMGVNSPRSIRSRTSVEELRRQLGESSKRLEEANSRLNGLADQDLSNSKTTNFFSGASFRGINYHMISSLEDPSSSSGSFARNGGKRR